MNPLKWLCEPSLAGIPVGTATWFAVQRDVIKSRPLMKHCYDLWYQTLLQDAATVPGEPESGVLLELGSGSSFIKEHCARVITSDVREGIAERVIFATALPFPDSSVRAIFMTHVFHHIPDVAAFLSEAERVLIPGGVVSMVDVAHTPFARFFFSRFHDEPYDDKVADWAFAQSDAMRDANQALTWIVFDRDVREFERRFPGLRVEQRGWLPWFSYMLSGGVKFRRPLPTFLNPMVIRADDLLRSLDRWMSLHWHLRVRKLS